jgi:hypothetical protein
MMLNQSCRTAQPPKLLDRVACPDPDEHYSTRAERVCNF